VVHPGGGCCEAPFGAGTGPPASSRAGRIEARGPARRSGPAPRGHERRPVVHPAETRGVSVTDASGEWIRPHRTTDARPTTRGIGERRSGPAVLGPARDPSRRVMGSRKVPIAWAGDGTVHIMAPPRRRGKRSGATKRAGVLIGARVTGPPWPSPAKTDRRQAPPELDRPHHGARGESRQAGRRNETGRRASQERDRPVGPGRQKREEPGPDRAAIVTRGPAPRQAEWGPGRITPRPAMVGPDDSGD
jgi:hypothetical protein